MMMTMEGMMDKGVLEDIIRRLLDGKGGKQVQLSEAEIRHLCVNARHVFLSQPNLLQLHAPIRIAGQLSPDNHFEFCNYDMQYPCFVLCRFGVPCFWVFVWLPGKFRKNEGNLES